MRKFFKAITLRGVWCDKKSRCFELLIGRNSENHLCRQMNLRELIKPL